MYTYHELTQYPACYQIETADHHVYVVLNSTTEEHVRTIVNALNQPYEIKEIEDIIIDYRANNDHHPDLTIEMIETICNRTIR